MPHSLEARELISLLQANLTAPFTLKRKLQIHIARSAREAGRYRDKGWCPIECSAGAESIVDKMTLDHHGALSDLEGVALRGYNEFYGCRVANPKIVFLGFPDEDATFCAASVLGLVPHPILADVFPNLPDRQRGIVSQNLSHLAELINQVDINHDAGKTLDDTQAGRLMILWRQSAHPTASDNLAWWGGIDRWRIYTTRDLRLAQKAAVELQQEQLEKVLSAEHLLYGPNDEIAVVDFSEFGRNSIFYDHWMENKTPLLIAYFSDLGVCSIIAKSMEWVQERIGPKGLLHLYPFVKPSGAGGREVLGGTSRFDILDWEGAKSIGEQFGTFFREIDAGSFRFKKARKRRR